MDALSHAWGKGSWGPVLVPRSPAVSRDGQLQHRDPGRPGRWGLRINHEQVLFFENHEKALVL